MPDGTVEQFASLVLRLIDAAGIGRFFVGGHSLGGMMAIEMADQAASRLDGIISCEGWTHHSVERDAFHQLKNETLTADQLEQLRYYGTIARTHWTDEEIRQYTKIWRKWEKGWDLLCRTEVPVLELWGDRGLKERPDRKRMLIPDRPNIELVWIERGGHSMLVQHPERIGGHIADFIRRH